MIIALADRLRLPAVYRIPQFAQRGGLSSYANDVRCGYRPAAGYVDRILKGEKPADLPVQTPTKYELELHGGRRQLALSLQGVRIFMRALIRPSDVHRIRGTVSITLRRRAGAGPDTSSDQAGPRHEARLPPLGH